MFQTGLKIIIAESLIINNSSEEYELRNIACKRIVMCEQDNAAEQEDIKWGHKLVRSKRAFTKEKERDG